MVQIQLVVDERAILFFLSKIFIKLFVVRHLVAETSLGHSLKEVVRFICLIIPN